MDFLFVISRPKLHVALLDANVGVSRKFGVISMGMLTPRKFLQKRKAPLDADQKKWRGLMKEIEEAGSAVSVLTNKRINDEDLPRDLVLGTLVRFKQLKKWKYVSEVFKRPAILLSPLFHINEATVVFFQMNSQILLVHTNFLF